MIAQLDRGFIRTAPGRAASRLVGYTFFEGRPVTTSGRWWNPVVFANLRLATRRPGKQVDRPVFIVGMGRSGTTLLGRILATHPSVGYLNEPKAMWHIVRDDEDIIGSYASPNTGRLFLGSDDATDAAQRRARALFAWYLRASHSERVVDKYPELVFRHAFVRGLFPDARFLIAIRAPWSTLNSVAKWSDVHATDGADWWGVENQKWDILWKQGVLERSSNSDIANLSLADETNSHVRAAVEWIVTMREAIALATHNPLAHVVRYEDLVREPHEVVREIQRFCELERSPRTERFADEIVSQPEVDNARSEATSRLPRPIIEALERTWSQIDIIDR